MNMEELTKSQIVLLTLFVSFVTSIATGIVTVSLVQQAPPAITQSVSRVIQETVQTVAPSSNSQHAAATVTEEKTVVVNDSDLVSKAVASVTPSIVHVYLGTPTAQSFVGLGVVLDSNGTIAADSDALGENSEAMLTLSDGTLVRAFVRARDAGSGIAYLVAATSSVPAPKWVPISVAGLHVVLGQSVIAISGKTILHIASGLIASIVPGSASSSPQVIETDIASGAILPGSPLIDTNGALLGLSTGPARASDPSDFMSASALSEPVLK
jgi:hypothetical protein